MEELLHADDRGIACPRGGFFVDPWSPVEVAVITHAHADHARPGMGVYHCAEPGNEIAARRLGDEARIVPHAYGESFILGEARVSLHPAGHILGSSQVRVEVDGEVWVVSGDFKRDADPTVAGFELLPCDAFVTEATFALPIYRWPDPADEIQTLLDAWREAAAHGRNTVVFAYALGKAQRVLSLLSESLEGDEPPGPLLTHGAVEAMNELYRRAGVELPETTPALQAPRGRALRGALVVAPPSAAGSPFLRRFGDGTRFFASGFMRLRGPRRRRAVDRGLVISDHADWPALLSTIGETGARRIRVTHGYAATLSRFLRDQGMDAQALDTRFVGEAGDSD